MQLLECLRLFLHLLVGHWKVGVTSLVGLLDRIEDEFHPAPEMVEGDNRTGIAVSGQRLDGVA